MAQFLMLIKITQTVRANPELANWIRTIDEEYMEEFGDLGGSVAHVALEGGDWDYALLFNGSTESAQYLTAQIMARAADTTIQTMIATDLDIGAPA